MNINYEEVTETKIKSNSFFINVSITSSCSLKILILAYIFYNLFLCIYFFQSCSPFLKIKKKILFIFRELGREGERDGEKHQCVVASHVPPTGDLA